MPRSTADADDVLARRRRVGEPRRRRQRSKTDAADCGGDRVEGGGTAGRRPEQGAAGGGGDHLAAFACEPVEPVRAVSCLPGAPTRRFQVSVSGGKNLVVSFG